MSQPQSSSKQITLTEDQFFEQFKPLKNPLFPDASYEGCLLDTSEAEMAIVSKALKERPLHLWTVVEGENNSMCICEGFHVVDRMGYIVTTVPAVEGCQYSICSEGTDLLDENSQTIVEVSMTDFFSYETPEELVEWAWLEKNASFKHAQNGEYGIWEFILNVSNDLQDIPPSLELLFAEAKRKNIAYLLFNQGT